MFRIILLLAAILSCQDVFSNDDVQAAIEARNKEWTDAFNRGDIQAVSAIYDEDFVAIPPASEPVTDRKEFESIIASYLSVAKNMKFTTLSLKVVGTYAYELGKSSYSLKSDEGEWSDAGDEYLVIWKKGEDGVWDYHIDAWW